MQNLRPYFLIRFILFGIAFGVTLIFLVVGNQREALIKDSTRTGKAISESLVAHGEYGVITANREILESLVAGLGSNKDILYAQIVDTVLQSGVLANYNSSGHSLVSLNKVPENPEVTVRIFPGDVEYLDIITPYYFESDAIVHGDPLNSVVGIVPGDSARGRASGFFRIGLSIESRLDELSDATSRICLVVSLSICLFSLYYYYLLTRIIVRPLKSFLAKTRSIRSGHLEFIAEENSLKNEIGDLGVAFEETVNNLKIAVEATRASEERLNLITASAKDGIVLTDLGGQILFVNPAFKNFFGLNGRLGRNEKLCNYIRLCRGECSENAVSSCTKNAEERENLFKIRAGCTDEFTGKRVEGGHFPLELSLSMAESDSGSLVVGVVRDISSRKASEKELRVLSSVLKQTEDMVIVVGLDWRIEYVNPGFCKVTGFSFTESLGKEPRFLSYDEDAEKIYAELKRVVSGGEFWRGRLVNRQKNGGMFEEDVSAFPLLDEEGQLVNYIFVMQDVTAKVQLERTLLQTRRMEAIGMVAGGIAHDFNNILTSIKGFTNLAMRQVPDESREEHFLRCVLEGADRGADLIKIILNFGSDSRNRVVVDIEKVVNESIMLLKPSLPDNVKIKEELKSGYTVLASESEMHQVIMNVCSNAIDAMDETGGVLEISTQTTHIKSTMDSPHVNLKAGKYVKLGIRDTGVGMPPDVVERVFEPFFTQRKEGKGTGLGLYTTHRVVDDMGGGITIHSVVGEGTLLNIYLHINGNG